MASIQNIQHFLALLKVKLYLQREIEPSAAPHASDLLKNDSDNAVHLLLSLESLIHELNQSNEELNIKVNELSEKLEKNSILLEEAKKVAFIGTWNWEVNTDKIELSEELNEIYQLSPIKKSVNVTEFLSFVPEPDKTIFFQKITASIQLNHSFEVYHRIETGRSNEKIILCKGFVFCDQNGKVYKMIGSSQDVTERVQEEKKFIDLIEGAPDAIITLNEEGRIVDWNKKAEEITGWNLLEVQNCLLSDKIVPLKYQKVFAESLQNVSTNQERNATKIVSASVFRKDGKLAPVEFTFSTINYGKSSLIVVFIRDVTEQVRLRKILWEKEELYRTVVESLSEGLIITDVIDRVFFANSKIELLTGYSSQEMIGKFAHKLFNIDKNKIDVERLNERMKGKSEAYELKMERKDGSRFIAMVNASPYVDEDGNIIGTVSAISDITEKKKEQEVEVILKAAIKSNNPVFILNHKTEFFWLNDGFINLSGYSLEELKNKPFEAARSIPDKNILERLKTKSLKQDIVFETKSTTKRGEEYWVITSLTPIYDEEGKLARIIGIDTDITKRKQKEEELIIANQIAEHSLIKGSKALDEVLKANTRIEQSVHAKEKFLANMSHEIRTPMNGIIGLTNLLLQSPLNLDQEKYLNAIKSSGETLMVVLNDILDISKIEAGKMILEKKIVNLKELIASSHDLFLAKAAEKNLHFNYSLDKNLPENIIGDPNRLKQILMNLICNALKFTNEGQVNLNLTLVNKSEKNCHILFKISDTGIGISKENMKRIFDDFNQGATDISNKYGGSGLGLTISKKLLELHNSLIKVESEENVGSTFAFEINFEIGPHEAPVVQQIQNAEQIEKLKNKKILLVEDNGINRMLAEKILENWGCHVVSCDNGKSAIASFYQTSFDLILLDIKMPEMDGYEVAKTIRTAITNPHKNTPIIALTAHAATWETEKCIAAGMNDFISKPFSNDELSLKMYNLIQKPDFININTSLDLNAVESDQPRVLEYSSKEVDLSYLEMISKGNSQFMLKMIGTFVRQCDQDMELLKGAIIQKDYETVYGMAHKIKSSFQFVKSEEIRNNLIQIEKLAKAKEESTEYSNLFAEIFINLNHIKDVLDEKVKHLTL